MADKQTILSALGRIQAGLSNVAGDIRSLKGKIVPGMTQADVDEVNTQAESLAASIESLAAETPEEGSGSPTEEGGAGTVLHTEEPGV